MVILLKTGMITFIKAKLRKSDDQTNIDKYRVAANITEYHLISKLIMIWLSFHLENVCKNAKNQYI